VVCEQSRNAQQTPEQRRQQIDAALQRLEQSIKGGSVTVIVGPNGAVVFKDWQDRDGVTDVCAFRMLQARRSWELMQAVQRAEGLAGRKVSQQSILGGTHSHDGGKTWHPGH